MGKRPKKPDGVPARPRHKTRTQTPRTKTTRTLKTLIDDLPSPDDLAALNAEFVHGSDRACALIAAVTLETSLTMAILTRLENIDKDTVDNLKNQNGALGGLFAKIYLGYALALYDKETRDDMDIIRKIRNSFAHAPRPISFNEKEVSDACNGLNHKEAKFAFGDTVNVTDIIHKIGFPNMSLERLKYLKAAINICKELNTLSKANLTSRIKVDGDSENAM